MQESKQQKCTYEIKVSILRDLPVIRENVFGYVVWFMHVLITVFRAFILGILFIKVVHERRSLNLR